MAGPRGGGPKLGEHRARVLPGPRHPADERAVAGPGVPVAGAEVRHELRPERIQVEVADQFQEVGLFLHHDRLVPVLEEVAASLVAPVEGTGVPREEAPHAPG